MLLGLFTWLNDKCYHYSLKRITTLVLKVCFRDFTKNKKKRIKIWFVFIEVIKIIGFICNNVYNSNYSKFSGFFFFKCDRNKEAYKVKACVHVCNTWWVSGS